MSEPVFHCDLQSTVRRFTVYRFLFCWRAAGPVVKTQDVLVSWFSVNWKNLVWALANQGKCSSS
jgi:hypothetical protein